MLNKKLPQLVNGMDRRHLQLTPGMTGHWQTIGSSRVPLAEMVKLDYLYVAGWSLWSDVTRVVKKRLASAAYPQIYKSRAHIPRYNVHEPAEAFRRRAQDWDLGDVPLCYRRGAQSAGQRRGRTDGQNLACFEQIPRKLGFRRVEVVGRNTGISHPGGSYHERPVLHTTR